MEIRQTHVYPSAPNAVVPRSEVEFTRRPEVADRFVSSVVDAPASAEDIRDSIRLLEEQKRRMRDQDGSQAERLKLSTRAQQALNSYRDNQNQPQQDAAHKLSQLLGIDYYA